MAPRTATRDVAARLPALEDALRLAVDVALIEGLPAMRQAESDVGMCASEVDARRHPREAAFLHVTMPFAGDRGVQCEAMVC